MTRAAKQDSQVVEPERRTPVRGDFDVIVSGGGPSGCAAAIRAAREGARTLLIERGGCLGGIWTAGLMPWIIDHENKTGLMAELREALLARGGRLHNHKLTAPPEIVKLLLDELCLAAGVRLRCGTMTVGGVCEDRLVKYVVTESKSGREAWSGKMFVDATGDGDLAARSGCGFDYGNADGLAQPASLIALLGGVDPELLRDYLAGVTGKVRLFELLCANGCRPSYEYPSLFHFGGGILGLMSHHAYGVCGFDADSRTRAVLAGRAELHNQLAALRRAGGVWRNLQLIATAEQLGVREGRRIHGRAAVTSSDLACGKRPAQTVCVSRFGIDVHAPDPEVNRSVLTPEIHNTSGFGIPYPALISADRDNLLLSGRCISGDFLCHASYRVTGNAVPTGEAAGAGAARAALRNCPPWEVRDIPCFSDEP